MQGHKKDRINTKQGKGQPPSPIQRKEGNFHQDYFQALSAVDAVDYMGIPHDQVIEVSVVLKDWKRSK